MAKCFSKICAGLPQAPKKASHCNCAQFTAVKTDPRRSKEFAGEGAGSWRQSSKVKFGSHEPSKSPDVALPSNSNIRCSPQFQIIPRALRKVTNSPKTRTKRTPRRMLPNGKVAPSHHDTTLRTLFGDILGDRTRLASQTQEAEGSRNNYTMQLTKSERNKCPYSLTSISGGMK